MFCPLRPQFRLVARTFYKSSMATTAIQGDCEARMVVSPKAKIARIEPEMSLKVKKLVEHAILPQRGSAGAAGYDLSR